MSGSRGEANFVWKCKNCKVSFPETELRTFANMVLSESRLRLSSPDLQLMNRLSLPRPRRSLNSTAEVSNLLSSRQRYISCLSSRL